MCLSLGQPRNRQAAPLRPKALKEASLRKRHRNGVANSHVVLSYVRGWAAKIKVWEDPPSGSYSQMWFLGSSLNAGQSLSGVLYEETSPSMSSTHVTSLTWSAECAEWSVMSSYTEEAELPGLEVLMRSVGSSQKAKAYESVKMQFPDTDLELS